MALFFAAYFSPYCFDSECFILLVFIAAMVCIDSCFTVAFSLPLLYYLMPAPYPFSRVDVNAVCVWTLEQDMTREKVLSVIEKQFDCPIW